MSARAVPPPPRSGFVRWFLQAAVMAERLRAEAKVARDRRIVLDRARGLPWPTTADRHDLTERQCRNVWAQRSTAGQELGERDAVEELRDLLDELDAAGEACALLIES